MHDRKISRFICLLPKLTKAKRQQYWLQEQLLQFMFKCYWNNTDITCRVKSERLKRTVYEGHLQASPKSSMSEKAALCSDAMSVWPLPDGMNPVLSAHPTVREPQDNSLTPRSSGQAGKFSRDAWLKAYYTAQRSSLSLKTPKIYVLSRCLASSERQPRHTISDRRVSQQKKIFTPAIMGDQISSGGVGRFYLFIYF